MKKAKILQQNVDQLIQQEGWEISGDKVIAYGQTFPLVHPFYIYSKLYRKEENPETKFFYLKKMDHILWPHLIPTWNYWTERRFRAHCKGYNFLSLAGGASSAKSMDAARIACLMWLSDPENNAVIVASTTLQSLSKRIWGYMVRLMHNTAIPVNYHYTKSPSPQFVFNKEDEIHSMCAMAAGIGTDEQAIRNYIGRHPNKKFLLILDEATDLNPFLLKAVPNLEAGEEGKLQVWVIGNSLSKSDLHGALSTPLKGWRSVDRLKDLSWATTQKNGICLYFPEWDSPAIHELDPVKKALLAKFLITQEKVDESKKLYGENSIDYMRFTAGFWQEMGAGSGTFATELFLKDYKVSRRSLWSGLHALQICGGLDPAFSLGGDACILRLGILGQSASGQIVLDFRDTSLLFKLKMLAAYKDEMGTHLADQVIDILTANRCPLENIAVDCTGAGRVWPELIRLRAQTRGIVWGSAMMVVSSRNSGIKNNQPGIKVATPTELWDNTKAFMQTQQICGLDDMAVYQMTQRLIVTNPKTKKRELESKLEFRNRMSAINPGKGTSPDEADGASLCVFSAIHKFGFHLEQTRALEEKQDFFSEKYNLMKKAEIVEEKTKQPYIPKATFTGKIGSGIKGLGR